MSATSAKSSRKWAIGARVAVAALLSALLGRRMRVHCGLTSSHRAVRPRLAACMLGAGLAGPRPRLVLPQTKPLARRGCLSAA